MLQKVIAFCSVLRQVKFTQRELDNLVYRKLKSVLISAFKTVPYYQETMKKIGYDPTVDYRGPSDLEKMPITTKKDLKEKGKSQFIMQGTDTQNCFSDSTSGSTGIPITIYRSSYERALQISKWLRVLFLNGYLPHQKVMSLTSPARLSEGRLVIQRFGLLRRCAVDYLRPADEMVDILLRYKPQVLYGNRSHLDLMAQELKKRNIRVLSLKLLMGGAEIITESSRALYREQFGIELVETYGTVEMGVMAYETSQHDGLHLCEDLTYFEFLDKNNQPVPHGEPGRVVVTDLNGKIMPFIRYEQGDLAVYSTNKNKREEHVRRIQKIIGRDDDYVTLPDGSRRSFHDFYEIMDKYQEISQFRIIQEKIDLFKIIIVSDASYILQIKDNLLNQLQEKFSTSIHFEISLIDKIPPDPSGKIRMLICNVNKIIAD